MEIRGEWKPQVEALFEDKRYIATLGGGHYLGIRGAWQPQVEALFGDKRCMATSGGGII